MLEKIIHQVWAGDKPFPERDLIWAQSIKRTHPDWQFVLHAEHPDNIPKVDSSPWDFIRPLPDLMLHYIVDGIRERMSPKRLPAAIADIARLEILIQEGGVYLDTDVVGIKSINDIMINTTLALSWEYSQNQIGNFFIAAEKQHPALINVLNDIHATVVGASRACHDLNPFWTCGPKVIEQVLPEYPDCKIFPFSVMSPWNPTIPFPEDYSQLRFPPCVRLCHLFDSKWTNLPRDPSIPLERGFDFHWDDSHCRDEDEQWCPDPDGHYEWPCSRKDRKMPKSSAPLDYGYLRNED